MANGERRRFGVGLRLLSVSVLCVLSAAATADEWINAAGGAFEDPTNWLDGSPPLFTETAEFDLEGGPYTVTLNQDQSIAGLLVPDDRVVFDLGGNDLEVLGNAGFDVALGAAGDDSSVEIVNGRLVTLFFSRLGGDGKTADVTVQGVGSRWDASGTIDVGFEGTGTLNILGGARASIDRLDLADQPGSEGHVLIDGAGSAVDIISGGTLGEDGLGTLTVSAGGTLGIASSLSVGTNPSPSQILVTGVGSRLIKLGGDSPGLSLGVGNDGNGSLLVEQGALVELGQINVANGNGATSRLTVGGAVGNTEARVLLSHNLNVGNFSNRGTVEVNEGGYLEVGGTIDIDSFSGAPEVLEVNGGRVVAEAIVIGSGNRLDFHAGEISTRAFTFEGDLSLQGATPGDHPVLNLLEDNSGLVDGTLYLGGDFVGPGNPATLNIGPLPSSSSPVFEVTVDTRVYANGQLHIAGNLVTDRLISDGVVTLDTGNPFVGITAGQYQLNTPLTWTSGKLSTPGALSTAALAGVDLTLTADKQLESTDLLTVEGGDVVTVDGGELRFGTLAGAGTIDFQRGVVTATGGRLFIEPGLPLGDSLVVGDDRTLRTTSTHSIEIGSNGYAQVVTQGNGRIETRNVIIGAEGSFAIDGGTVNVESILHTSGGDFSFTDGVLSMRSIGGDLVQDGGTLDPTMPPGTLLITGDYVMNAGTLAIEFDGPLPGSGFDQVTVRGDAFLGPNSVLDLSRSGGFVPALDDSFTILATDGTITGTFGEVLGTPGLSRAWNVRYTSSSVEVSVVIAGDYNGSGQVEQADLDLVLQNWGVDTDTAGVPAGWLADLPTGLIDQAELDGVLLNWGDTAVPDVSGVSVPEPAGLAVVLVGVLRRRAAFRRA